MSRKRKILLISLVASALAAVLAALLWPKTPAVPPQLINLSTGAVCEFAGATFGTNHVLGTFAARTLHRLSAPTQVFLRRILGSHFPAVQSARTTPQPCLVTWFNVATPIPPPIAPSPTGRLILPAGPATSIVAVLADENGVESGAQIIVMRSAGNFARFAEFPILPRRSRTLQLRVYESEFRSQILAEIGSFKFPNPVYGKFPQWQPDTGPLIRKTGDLEVHLDKFFVGKRVAGKPFWLANGQQSSNYEPAHNRERAETVFDISLNSPEGDGTNSPWLLQNAALSDATGNDLDNSFMYRDSAPDFIRTGLSPMDDLGASRRTLPGALWPDESAWKLRLEFKRTNGFNANELVTFKNVPVPARGTINKPGLRLRVGDAQVTLAEFRCNRAPTADEFEALRRGASVLITDREAPTFLRFEITGRRDGLAVDFVRLTTATQRSNDEAWAKLDGPGSEPRLTFNSWQPGVRVIGLSALSTNAQTVDITLSVQKMRTVEFLLKPPK